MEELRQSSLMMMLRDASKRIIDIVGSGLGLLISLPLVILAACSILFTMGFPVCFLQLRPGIRGRPFLLIKFRTMRRCCSQEETNISRDNARLTFVGKILRKTSIDELPTLINVLKGDMSLVGPRPLLMQYLERYSSYQKRRLEVKPGVTGWAQIHGRNAISWDEKFAYDVWYVDNRSTWIDLRILTKTILKVARCEGIAHKEAATMPEFMGSREDGHADI